MFSSVSPSLSHTLPSLDNLAHSNRLGSWARRGGWSQLVHLTKTQDQKTVDSQPPQQRAWLTIRRKLVDMLYVPSEPTRPWGNKKISIFFTQILPSMPFLEKKCFEIIASFVLKCCYCWANVQSSGQPRCHHHCGLNIAPKHCVSYSESERGQEAVK